MQLKLKLLNTYMTLPLFYCKAARLGNKSIITINLLTDNNGVSVLKFLACYSIIVIC